MPAEGRVAALALSPEHAFSKARVESARFARGLGLEGDAHAGETVKHRSRVAADPTQPNLRQVHLIGAELLTELEDAGFEVSPGRLGENVLTEGVDLLALPTDTELALGARVRLRLTGLRNPCVQLDQIGPGLMKHLAPRDERGALIRRAGVMAVVLEGGEVHVGDPIRIELPAPPHVALDRV